MMPWPCPECGYALDFFDRECLRCHGKGTQETQTQKSPAQKETAVAPLPVDSGEVVAWETLPDKEPASAAQTTHEAKALRSRFALLGVGSSLAILLIAGATVLYFLSPGRDKETAYLIAREAVRSQLIVPLAAVFPRSEERGVTVEEINGEMRIASFVDAQGRSGNKVRMRWSARLKRDDDGKNWMLMDATIIQP
jgi:hypothetical protein